MIPKVGKTYSMTFPNDTVTVATFDRIITYLASGMPSDYIFRYKSGYDRLMKASQLENNCFPFPASLVQHIKFEEISTSNSDEPEVDESKVDEINGSIAGCYNVLEQITKLKMDETYSGDIDELEVETKRLLSCFEDKLKEEREKVKV